MTNYIDTTLGEIAEIIGGGTPKTSELDYWGGSISWITPKDLTGYGFRYIRKGDRNITTEGLNKSSARLLPKNTVLMTSRAPIGYLAIAEKELTTNQGFKSLVVKEDKADYLYIYYWLKSNMDFIKGLGTGSTFAEISGKSVKEIQIKIPESVEEQRAIARVLSSLDDKIELLQQQNKTLEELAQTLFKHTFIDNNSKEMTLESICTSVAGYAFKSKSFVQEGIPIVKIKNINNGQVDISEDQYISDEDALKLDDKFKLTNGDLVMAMTGATIGKTGMVITIDNNYYLLNQRVAVLRSKYQPLLWALLNSLDIESKVLNMSNGAVQANISTTGIGNINIPHMDEIIMQDFNSKVKPMFDKVSENIKQIATLKQTRDTLLPKLISGEIKVKDIENDS